MITIALEYATRPRHYPPHPVPWSKLGKTRTALGRYSWSYAVNSDLELTKVERKHLIINHTRRK